MKRLIFLSMFIVAVQPVIAQNAGVGSSSTYNPGYNPGVANPGYNPGFGINSGFGMNQGGAGGLMGGTQMGGYPMGVYNPGVYTGAPGQRYYYPTPIPAGGGNFSFRLGGMNATLWRSPSGYYYPFSPGTVMNPTYFPLGQRVIFMNPAANTPPEAKLPPLSVQFSDTLKFLDDAKKDKKISDVDYDSLRRRTIDIQKKERSYRISQGGSLDGDLEGEIRRDLENLSNEIAERVKQD